MRWSTTLGAWTRREALLVSVLAAGAALAALSKPLGTPWLAVAGLVVAALGALARLGLATGRGRLEADRERAELDRRLRAPVAEVDDVDPTTIGVDPAAQDLLVGDRVPRYLPRHVDAELAAALADAVEGRASWLVVVVGRSKIGKSRSLFEALRTCHRTQPAMAGLQLVAPIDGEGLRALLLPGQGPRLGPRPVALWLDDIEPFLNQGLTWQTLQEWRGGGDGRIVVATYGGKGSDLIADAGAGETLVTTSGQLLQQAREIPMTATDDAELSRLDGLHADERPGGPVSEGVGDVLTRFGLAAYLVAGPALERKLVTARHAPGQPPCAEGVAVVEAAVDWARCGRTDAISETLLREVWPHYLPASLTDSDDSFARGLDWALRPVAGEVALLYRAEGYAAYDYVVRLVGDRVGGAGPPDEVWSAAVRTADPDQAASIVLVAFGAERFDDAARALAVARQTSDREAAAIAAYNEGVLLHAQGRHEEAIAAYSEVVERYGDDPDLREQASHALVNLAGVTSIVGRHEDAIALYQQAAARYGDDPAPDVRRQVATALVNLGNELGTSSRHEDAIATYRQVVDRYGDDATPALREVTSGALLNIGIDLGKLDRHEEALDVYQRVVDRYGDDPAPSMRARTARARVYRAIDLGALGRLEDAVVAGSEVVEDYGNDPDSDVRRHVARALMIVGARLDEQGLHAGAAVAYQEVVDRYGADPGPELRELSARVLLCLGVTLGEVGRREEAVAVLVEVDHRYGDDPSPVLRVQSARALSYRGVYLGELGRRDEAITAFRTVDDRYRDDPSGVLRQVVVISLAAVGEQLEVLDRRAEAVAVFRQVLARYGNDPDPELRGPVRLASESIGNTGND